MKDVAERIAALPPDQQAMLLKRLRQQQANQSAANSAPAPASLDSWIVRFRPNADARLRLFCFSYAGGGASVFRSWPDALPSDVEVCAVQLPGRENRIGEQAHKRMGPLIEDIARALDPYLDKPFVFFGHSMGALVSFELARYLRRSRAKHPLQMHLAAFRAPHLPNPNIKIYHLPSEVFKVVLRAEGIAEMILQNEELMKAMLPTLRADFELCDTYEYREEPPLDCPFMIFGGQDDVRISVPDLEAWPIHSSAEAQLSILPGAHFFVHSAQDLLLAQISQHLEACLNSPTTTGLVHG